MMYGIKSKNIPLIYANMIMGGMLFFLPVIALYLEKSLFSLTNVAIIFAIEAICIAIFEVPTGAISDLFGRKRTLVLANAFCILGLVFLAIGGSMLMFIIWAIINYFAISLNSGTDSALVYDTLKQEKKEKKYKRVIGTYHAMWPVGAVVGSIIGGYLATISLAAPALYSIIPIFIAFVITLFLKEPQYEKSHHKNVLKHMIKSVKVIFSNKQLIILMVGGLIIWGFGESIHHFNSIFFEFKGIPLVYFGYILAVIFALSSLGHYFSHNISEKIGNKQTIIIAPIISTLLIIFATFSDNMLAIVLFVASSLFFGLRRPVIDHLLNIEVESKIRATVISVNNLMQYLGFAILVPFVGYFAELYNINTAFRIAALFMFITPILFMWLKNKN